MAGKIADRWLRMTQLDLRTLGAVRVALGLLTAWIHLQYLLQARVFFADEGVFPRQAVLNLPREPFFFSLHMLSGDLVYQIALSVLGILFSLALAAGFRAKLFHVLAWYWIASAQARVPLTTQGGDYLLRMFLLFALFLPWEEWFSWDARKVPRENRRTRFESWANTGLLLQLAVVYWFAALMKRDPSWLNGTAVFFALHHGSYATWFADLLLKAPLWLLQALSYSVLVFEVTAPFLFFANWIGRTVACFLFVFMHLGFGLSFVLTTFPFITTACVLSIFPSEVWNRMQKFSSPVFRAPFTWRQPLSLFFIVAVLIINAQGYLRVHDIRIANPLKPLASALFLHQQWVMFASVDRKDRGFYRVVGRQPDGGLWGYFEDELIDLDDVPERTSAIYPSMEWKRLMNAVMRESRGRSDVTPMAPFLCREMAGHHVISVSIYHYHRRLEFGAPPPPYKRRRLIEYSCSEHRITFDLRNETDTENTQDEDDEPGP